MGNSRDPHAQSWGSVATLITMEAEGCWPKMLEKGLEISRVSGKGATGELRRLWPLFPAKDKDMIQNLLQRMQLPLSES